MFSYRLLFATTLVSLFSSLACGEVSEQEKFFESQVRPLLAQHCYECHSDKKQQGDLRLDRKQFVFNEGPAGKAVVPGNLEQSKLWKVVQYDEFETQMPPTGKLSAEKIEILKKWIDSGAFWPEEADTGHIPGIAGIPQKLDGSIDFERAIATHWAYQPVDEPQIPHIDHPELNGTVEGLSPIDKLLLAKLNEKGLSFSEPTSKQRSLRRLSFDLRGLPPAFAEVQNFEQNPSTSAFADVVDRYLSDPAYGQRWGRYWLDIARYADTKGYVFTANRFYPYSYTYRDYVIDAFNEDKPYDRFIMEQLAADHLGLPDDDPNLAALGFLTVGPRFLNSMPDIIDDRIDVVTRGLMGMTLGCARCHDHKFDPLPTADYYSMYGVFDSSYEPELPPLRGKIDPNAPGYSDFASELAKREAKLKEYQQTAHDKLLVQAKDQLDDYFPAAVKALGLLPADLDLKPKAAVRDRLVDHWKKTLEKFSKANDPVFLPATKLLAMEDGALAAQFPQLLEELSRNESIPGILLEKLREANPSSRLGVVEVYVAVLAAVRDEWYAKVKEDSNATGLEDSGREGIRRVLFGEGSLTDLAPGDYSPLFERDNRDEISKLKKEIDEWHSSSPNAPPRSMVLFDKQNLAAPVIFIRGNNGRRGDRVPRRGPQILDPNPSATYESTSGRKDLAMQIVSKQNPLTARVLVNRVWMYHFGSPLVDTAGDFGLRTQPPVQRDLLDYLAWSLMHQHNWSLKGLHREILLSRAWQQQSDDRPEARKIDPENQLFWKQNRQRLDFEALRDSILAVSGKIDLSLGGRPVDIEKEPYPVRRSVYAFIDRNNPSGLLRTFDFPSPNSSSPGRSETTVPQQALFGMNSAFSSEMAKSLAEQVRSSATTPEEQAQHLIQLVFSRAATSAELETLQNYLQTGSLENLAQGVLLSNEFYFVD